MTTEFTDHHWSVNQVSQEKVTHINNTVMMNHVIRYREIAWLNSSMFPPKESMTPDPGIKIVA